MRGRTALRVVFVLALAFALGNGVAAAGEIDALTRHVEYLASEQMQGRLTGTEGERLAAEYIVRELKQLGALPVPKAEGYLHGFEFTAGTRDVGSTLALEAEPSRSWTGVDRVRALSFSDNGSATAALVFVGYGLTVPDSKELSYDSYHGLDVKDKIVVALRYSPEEVEDDTRAELRRYSGLRYKALQARERGAKALLIVTGPASPNAGRTIESGFDSALSGSGILAASVDAEIADLLFAGVEGGLAKAQRDLDTGNPHVTGFDLQGVVVTLDVKLERERRTASSVVGYLPPSAGQDGPAVMLGAHYDHLGHGDHANSLARKDEIGQVHRGADDNASGVAAVLEAARKLAGRERPGPLLLAFWSGEELGLLGSSAFVKDGPGPAAQVAAYVNFDMVGRMQDNRLNVQGVGSSPVWPRLIERANVAVGFDVRTQADPYLPTDASSYYLAGVPVAALFTGSHEDYHRPTDTPQKVNYEDLERVVQFATRLTLGVGKLDEAPEYAKVERTAKPGGDRAGVRAYTGTLPDYASEVEGLRLSGVIGGGPAEQAGLMEGDVIIELAGRAVANIYDYTYALEAVKIDTPVKVVCMRDGKRLEFTITPTARP